MTDILLPYHPPTQYTDTKISTPGQDTREDGHSIRIQVPDKTDSWGGVALRALPLS